MRSKLTAACLALAAFAAMALVPAGASANPLLTDAGGTVKVGSTIEATNVGNITLSSGLGNISCQSSTLTGNVTANTAGNINGDITKATFTGTGANGHCTSTIIFNPTFTVDTAESLPWCLTNEGNTDNWTVRGGACNAAAKNLTFTLTGAFTCKYTRATVTGTFNTTTSPATLTIGAGQTFTKEEGSSALCPETGTLSGAWQLYTDTGVHNATTAISVDDL